MFEELKAWNIINGNDDNSKYWTVHNDQLCTYFYRSTIKSLCCSNGFEAIELLCRSYERVFTDVNMAMLKQGEENLKLFCVVRKWYNIVDPNWEFRLVIKDYKPTALTQYHKTIVIPHAAKYKTFLQKRILNTFDSIKDKLDKTLRDYTIDFAVVLKDKTIQNVPICINEEINEEKEEVKEDPIDTVYLIEINHEPPIAGTALFDFANEEDKKVLNGEKPFEFRMYENKNDVSYDEIDKILPDQCLEFVDVLQGKYIQQNTNQPSLFERCVLL